MSDTLRCKAECQEVVYRLSAALDRGANSEAAELFAEDARLVRSDGVFEGAAIRELILRRPPEVFTRHIVTNVLITPIGSETADGLAYVTGYRIVGSAGDVLPRVLPDTPYSIGEWFFHFREEGAGWRITGLETVDVLTSVEERR